MVQILFVRGSAGDVGVGTLRHRCALRKSIGGSGDVLDSASRKSVEMIAAIIWRNLIRFRLKTRYNRPHNLRLPALPE